MAEFPPRPTIPDNTFPLKIVTNDPLDTRSFRDNFRGIDSSDSLPSESDPIYNAERVSSTEIRSANETPTNGKPEMPHLQLSSSLPAFGTLSASQNVTLPQQPRYRWPTQLEPIIERQSLDQLRDRPSVPRLIPSPKHVSKIVKPQISVHSIHPQTYRPTVRPPGHTRHQYCPRSFSVNDLDCFLKPDTKNAPYHESRYHSPSSEEALDVVRQGPSFPLKPSYKPPCRSSTPPGLPSFGTAEAQMYRLTPERVHSQNSSLFHRLLRRGDELNDERILTPNSPNSLPDSPTPQTVVSSPTMSVLRKVLGIPRIVESPQDDPAPRAPLPPGVEIAPFPGPLAQAHDRTFVRGRWGNRISGHGVGRQGIEAHPINRAAGITSIDNMIQRIEKACAAIDNENNRQERTTLQAVPDDEMDQRSEHASSPDHPQHDSNAAGISSTSFHIPGINVDGVPAHNGIQTTMLTSPEESARMNEPLRYALPSSQEYAAYLDNTMGSRERVQLRAREQTR